MQLAAIIVSLVLTAVGVALIGLAVAQIQRFVRLGQPVPAGSRTDDPKARTRTLAKEFVGHTRMNRWGVIGVAHWFVAVGFLTLGLTIVNAYGQLFKADWILPVLGDWLPYQLYVEFIALFTTLGILVLMAVRLMNLPSRAGRKSRFAGSTAWQAYFVEYVILVDRPGHPHPARPGGRAARRGPLRGRVLGLVPPGRRLQRARHGHPAEPGLPGRHDQARRHHDLGDHRGPQHRHGRGLAPLPGLPQHLVQARGRRAGRPRRAPADDQRRRPDRLRGPGRGRRLRRLPGRALLLEGPARLLHLHRVRPLPVAVPGVEHRQAALPEAADHVAARPRARQGALPAGRRRQDRRGRGEGHRRAAGRRPRRRARRGRAPARSAPPRRTASSTPTSCGRAPPAAPASSSARWTSSTSTTSSTCAATR